MSGLRGQMVPMVLSLCGLTKQVTMWTMITRQLIMRTVLRTHLYCKSGTKVQKKKPSEAYLSMEKEE